MPAPSAAARPGGRDCPLPEREIGGWDFYDDGNNPPVEIGMKVFSLHLDHVVSAFLEDVEAGGLSDKILLIITAEMGRTPLKEGKTRGGSGHWDELTPLVFAGGGSKWDRLLIIRTVPAHSRRESPLLTPT